MTATQPVKLSEEQEAIVYYNEGEGALLAVAGAGSGKTRILTERVRYLLTEKQGNFSVLCLTFTNKAAEEMKIRLQDVKGIKARSFIGTMHGFSLDILKARRHELGYDVMPQIIDKEADKKKIVEQVFLENGLLKTHYDQHPEKAQLLDKSLTFISEAKRRLDYKHTPQYEAWSEIDKLCFDAYNDALREQNLIDFDDILFLAWQILNDNPAAANLYRKSFKYILVDEAQDLTFAQYNLLKTLCGETHQNVFIVGDPNQSIHGYTGARKYFMEEAFVKDFGAATMEIRKNYRSSQQVIEFAHRLFPNGENGQKAHYEGRVEPYAFENEQEEAVWVTNKIKELIAQRYDDEIEGEIGLEKIAVLGRNRFVLLPLQRLIMQDAFFQNRFFFKKGSEALDMESHLMKLFDLGTRILSNPANQVHFRQIVGLLKINNYEDNSAKKGIERLKRLKDFCPNSRELEVVLSAWSVLEQQTAMLKALESIENYCKNAELPDEEKDLIMGDLDDYRDTWRRFCENSTTITLANFRQFAAMGFNNQQKQKGLTLATVHTVKGLEFDIVFVMGMNEGTFPDYRAKTDKELNEEKNSANVAFTRARRWLYLTYPKKKTTYYGTVKIQNKSRFLP